MRCSLSAANVVTAKNIRAPLLITAMTVAVAIALPAAGCGTRPAAGQSGPLRAILTASVPSPGEFLHVAAGPDAAWVTTGNALLWVDRRTDRVRTVLADPGAALTTVTYGAGSLWADDGDTGLLKINPVSGRVEARLRGAGSLESFGYDALWTAGYGRAGPALWRTDPATGSTRTFPLPCLKQFGLAAGAGGVWVSGVCSARGAMPGRPPYFSLVRADPATGQVTARYPVTPLPLGIVAGNGALWASGNGMVMRIDPRTGRATASIAVPAGPGRAFPGSGAGLLALTPGSLWVTAAGPAGYRVLRISTQTARLAGPGIAVPGTPLDLAASGSTLWVVTTSGLTRIDLIHCASGQCRPPAPPLPGGHQAPLVWLASLQMVSASQGWALAYTQSPNSPNPAQALLRTGDGGRTWIPATPPAAGPPPANGAYPVLLARSPSQAWLAVTWPTANGSYATTPSRTVVFATGDGGRTWTASAPIRSPGQARWMSFADPGHGWLVMDLGAAMGQDPVRIYRTTDGGARWTLAAASPPPPASQQAPGPPATGPAGISTACDKTGIVFASPRDGWLTTDCNDLADALVVSHDGGVTWQPQTLPIPPGACTPAGCSALPPQFSGRTGLLVITPGSRPPYLLRSNNRGATWHLLAVPPAARWFQAADQIDASHAVLVPGALPGQVRGPIGELWLTADGGQTWTALRQGTAFSPDTTISFASPIAGFAWNPNVTGAPPLYATTDSGRSWTWSVPRLAR